MLSHEQTLDYIRRAQAGDKAARDALTDENIALVKSVAARFGGRGVEWDDLFQLGCMGLIKAIDGFDVERGVRFSTYAVPMIMGEIRRYLRDDGQMRVSRQLRERARDCLRARSELELELASEPTLEQIAARAGLELSAAVEALASTQTVRSLSEPAGPDSDCVLADTLGEDDTERRIDRLELERGLSELEEREAELIRLRYFAQLTQVQIGARLGISQVRVSRLESRIIKKLRGSLSV